METSERIVSDLAKKTPILNFLSAFQPTVPALCDITLQVEKRCSLDPLYFNFDPEKRVFTRVAVSDESRELLEEEQASLPYYCPSCVKSLCFNMELDVNSFIDLFDFEFELTGVLKRA